MQENDLKGLVLAQKSNLLLHFNPSEDTNN